jgi:hypothetical protein
VLVVSLSTPSITLATSSESSSSQISDSPADTLRRRPIALSAVIS